MLGNSVLNNKGVFVTDKTIELVFDHETDSLFGKTTRRPAFSCFDTSTSRGTLSITFHGRTSLPEAPHLRREPSWILLFGRTSSSNEFRTWSGSSTPCQVNEVAQALNQRRRGPPSRETDELIPGNFGGSPRHDPRHLTDTAREPGPIDGIEHGTLNGSHLEACLSTAISSKPKKRSSGTWTKT